MEPLPNDLANAASRSNTTEKALACHARGPAREQLLAARNKAKRAVRSNLDPKLYVEMSIVEVTLFRGVEN